MDNKFRQLDNDSVVSFGSCNLKIQQLCSGIYRFLKDEGWAKIRDKLSYEGSGRIPDIDEKLFVQGLDCEVLQPGKNWQKGKFKLKISLEFQPDEPEIEAISENIVAESSLDEIRRKLNGVSS